MKSNIWQIRQQQKITLIQLAELTGISKSALNNYENDRRSPTLEDLEKIAIALDTHITDLFESSYK